MVPTDQNRNLILLAGDRMVAANCDFAANLHTSNTIWSPKTGNAAAGQGGSGRHRHHGNSVLMASCTEIQIEKNHFLDSSSFNRKWFGFVARDCVNGTLMPRKHLPAQGANYTLIHQLFLSHGMANKLDVDVEKIPYETDIIIYNKTKVGQKK